MRHDTSRRPLLVSLALLLLADTLVAAQPASLPPNQPSNPLLWEDGILINVFCMICVIVVLYPIVRYLSRHWEYRRDSLFSLLETNGAIVLYYRRFRPAEHASKDNKTTAEKDKSTAEIAEHMRAAEIAKYMRAFEKDFDRWYGRKYYAAPLVILCVLTGVSAWWASKILRAWAVDASSLESLRALVLAALGGAFVWIIADEMDRFRRRDFTVSDVYYYAFRLLLAIPFGWALTRVTVTLQVGIPLAFFLGCFPTTTLFTIGRRIASQQLKLGDEAGSGRLELEALQCVGKSNAERFKDEGVTTITGLAYADPIDLTIRTNFDFNYVVDCVSQALMWIYFGKDCAKLFALSLRGAQEVSAVMDWLDPDLSSGVSDDDAQRLPSVAQRKACAEETVAAAAGILNISKDALRMTLYQISRDPYTEFLVNVWD